MFPVSTSTLFIQAHEELEGRLLVGLWMGNEAGGSLTDARVRLSTAMGHNAELFCNQYCNDKIIFLALLNMLPDCR
jgi:hypothetical protein